MNPNVGQLYKGYPIQDASLWQSVVTNGLWAKCVTLCSAIDTANPSINDALAVPPSWAYQVDIANQFAGFDERAGIIATPYNFTDASLSDLEASVWRNASVGGQNGDDSGAGYWSVPINSQAQARIQASFGAWLNNPNNCFVVDTAQAGLLTATLPSSLGLATLDPKKNRAKVLYYRIGNIAVPIASQTYYSPSDWVASERGGLIFFIGMIFTLVGAPVVSAEVSALASGSTATVSAGATNASVISTLANTTGQLSGQQNIGLVGKVANLATGGVDSFVGIDAVSSGYSQAADSAAANLGAAPVDGLDIPIDSSSDPFGGFGFSSGESIVSFSDAQNTDFGLGIINPAGIDPNLTTGFSLAPSDNLGVQTDVFATNATPEVTTNDFGTTFDGPSGNASGSNWGGETNGVPPGAAPIAAAAAGASSTGQTATGAASNASSGSSGNKAVAASGGSNDVLSTVGNVLKAVGAATATAGGTASQSQAAQAQTFAGQLTALGGSSVNVGGTQIPVLYIGAALVLLAVFMHIHGGAA